MTKKTSYFQGDKYNSLAKKDGYRSRAAYKLIQIQKEFNLIQPGDTLLELGSAPGGWSQVASKIINGSGSITAIDVLPMKKIKYVNFHQIDLVDIEKLNLKKMSIVLSDIAPNISGVSFIDTANMNSLLEIEISIVDKFLQIGGKYLCKCFEGDSLDFLAENLKDRFKFVKRLKPEASRSISRELYVLGIEKI
ncbi:MAG: RlmE family RNA methyltransferase [Pseudomonadota bacterium]|nr:RlmE family RNA methyltransferase [Pseudomonadota bacterium]